MERKRKKTTNERRTKFFITANYFGKRADLFRTIWSLRSRRCSFHMQYENEIHTHTQNIQNKQANNSSEQSQQQAELCCDTVVF